MGGREARPQKRRLQHSGAASVSFGSVAAATAAVKPDNFGPRIPSSHKPNKAHAQPHFLEPQKPLQAASAPVMANRKRKPNELDDDKPQLPGHDRQAADGSSHPAKKAKLGKTGGGVGAGARAAQRTAQLRPLHHGNGAGTVVAGQGAVSGQRKGKHYSHKHHNHTTAVVSNVDGGDARKIISSADPAAGKAIRNAASHPQTRAGMTLSAAAAGDAASAAVAVAHVAAKHVKLGSVPKPPSKAVPAVNSNWESLRQAIGATGAGKQRKQEREKLKGAAAAAGADAAAKRPVAAGSSSVLTSVVALDCEMVGVGGKDYERSALARVCMVNSDGNVLLDVHVKPKEQVTNYRTHVSGIRPQDLKGGAVLTLEEVQQQVADMLEGRLLVGHALQNDLKALLLSHPHKMIRDTARFAPLMRPRGAGRRPAPRALRVLAREELGLVIQEGEHSPVDDARAALYLYQKHRKQWEAMLRSGATTLRRQMGLVMQRASKNKNLMNRDVRDDPMADL